MLGNGSSTGDGNVGIGKGVMTAFTTAAENVAVGQDALASATTAASNVAIGADALEYNVDGNSTVAIGRQACRQDGSSNNVTNADNCTFVGRDSRASSATPTNQIAIGYEADGKGDNMATIGNENITRVYMSHNGDAVIYANGTINTSDARFKKNVEDTDLGLSFINKIRPVKYDYKKNKDDGKKRYGIIAQEVLTVLKDSGNEDFAGIKTEDQDKLGADYIQFVAPLIKAVQELSSKVEELEKKCNCG